MHILNWYFRILPVYNQEVLPEKSITAKIFLTLLYLFFFAGFSYYIWSTNKFRLSIWENIFTANTGWIVSFWLFFFIYHLFTPEICPVYCIECCLYLMTIKLAKKVGFWIFSFYFLFLFIIAGYYYSRKEQFTQNWIIYCLLAALILFILFVLILRIWFI